ncbi:MAG: diphosphomevalonate decarboxylase, partial [Gammaproteobacteria bacterium]|nr:diphosphomevalonate decarboxylase [Gammaproteobacteria bacterium]
MRATAKAQPNIALIKYWGKRDTHRNLPAVGSISITLADLATTMSVDFDDALANDVLTVNGSDNVEMLPRVSRCIDSVAGPKRSTARVISNSNFPIAAGLASSASAFAALVVATDAVLDRNSDTATLARLAGGTSGSAARSLYGGFVELQNTAGDIALHCLCAADDWPLEVIVAITALGPKPVGSTEAMEISRKTSPFYGLWVEQQSQDLDAARKAIAKRDFARLAAVAEHNCLKMHSVMWGSRPATIYWNSATLACMQTVRELQSQGVAVFFTIDAGPQLKAVCEPADA